MESGVVMEQSKINAIPVEYIENEIKQVNVRYRSGRMNEFAKAAVELTLQGLLQKWEKEKDEWLHQEK